MKSILCFGDSNTWGFDPAAFARYPMNVRWPGILQRELGPECHIIEEGLPGRTTVWEDPISAKMSGKAYLVPCLESHTPLDLVIIMLGTNDLKKRFSITADDVANSVKALVDVTNFIVPGTPVLVLVPPPILEVGFFASMFEGGARVSQGFSSAFPPVIAQTKAELMDVSEYIQSSEIDGIHFDAPSHQILGEAVARKVKEMLKL